MKSKTIKAKTTAAIVKELDMATADGFKPTLAIIFLSIQQDRKAVCELFDKKGIAIFGATTAGEFIDGAIEEGSIVVMLLDMNKDSFKIEFLETTEQTTLEDAKKLGAIGKEIFTHPAFIIATGGIFIDGEQIIEGIIQGFGVPATSPGEVTIFGGMAGDDLLAEKPLVLPMEKAKTMP